MVNLKSEAGENTLLKTLGKLISNKYLTNMDQKRVQAPISTKPMEFVKPGQTNQEMKVAFDPVSRTMMTQKELFERTKGA